MSTVPPETIPATGVPLTKVEQRFYLLHHLHPDAPVANIGRTVELRGPLDVRALERAFRVVASHPMLRLRVREARGIAFGHLGAPPTLEVHDGANAVGHLTRAIDEVVKAPYDLERDAPFRARLLCRGPDDHVLVLGAHHLVLDGWALSRSLPRALCAAIRGEIDGVIADDVFIAARRATAAATDPDTAEAIERDRRFWEERLRGVAPASLPAVSTPSARPSGRAWDVELSFERELLRRTAEVAARQNARPVHLLLAAYAVELCRATRAREFVLGTTRAARTSVSTPSETVKATDERGLGCFVKTRALAIQLADDGTFGDAVSAARDAVRTSLEHPHVDAEDLHTLGAPPLTGLFNFIPFPAFDGAIDGVDIVGGRIIAGGTAFPVALTIDELGPAPRVVVEVDADAFDEGFAGRFAERFLTVLEGSLTSAESSWRKVPRCGRHDVLAAARCAPTDAERRHVVGGHLGVALANAFTKTGTALVSIVDVESSAADVAVERATLMARASSIARSLRAAGLGPGDFVGVHCEQPLRAVEAIVGVVLSGAAYVPLDPAAPALRRAALVAQAKLSVVLDDDAAAARASDECGPLDPGAIPSADDQPAYVIFTSGSTGVPKGVVVSHRAVMSQLQAREAFGFPHVERSLLLAPFFFDGSVETLFWSLTTGGTLYLLDEQARRDPLAIRRALSRRTITYTSAVPALWSAMLDACPPDREPLSSLGFVIVGGEKLTASLIEKHQRHTSAQLVNEYGPTETTVFSSAWTAPRPFSAADPRVLIGRSAPHVFCEVVDEHLEPVPVLEPGELVVSGPGLADGYLGAPALTAAAFVAIRRGEGVETRVYRTGDIVRLWPSGDLEWLSRRDEQVKLRGIRVEPGEVEAAIVAAGIELACGLDECAVRVDGDHLVAWVSPHTVDTAALLVALQERLPEVMIPARIIALAALPKTANDKVDKKALPRVDVDETTVPPATATEARVAATWAKVLGVDAVSVTKSFFALGGHSLKATIAVRAHAEEFGVAVPLSTFMAARTVRELARRIDAMLDAERPASSSPSRGQQAPLLQPLSMREGSPDVVFLPGIGGHVLTFAPLAELMTARSAGLRTLGSEEGETAYSSIEALATHNLQILDACGVRDDVVFAGYSFGGLVAFEMALQRFVQGRAPHQLVIFDTMAPGYPRKLPLLTRIKLHADAFARMDRDGRRAYLRDRAVSVREKLNLRFQRADAFAVAFARDADADAAAALSPAQRSRLEQLAGVSTLAHHRYWPRASIPVPMTLFAAEKNFDWAATRLDDPHKGWRTFITEPITRIELPGDHLRLLTPDNHHATAQALDALIASRGT